MSFRGVQSYKAQARAGAFRTCAAHLPRDHATALRRYCLANGVTISSVLGGLVAEWLTLKDILKDNQSHRDAPTAPVLDTPVHAAPRPETGRNAPISALKAIDADRKKQRDAGSMRD